MVQRRKFAAEFTREAVALLPRELLLANGQRLSIEAGSREGHRTRSGASESRRGIGTQPH